MDRSRSKRGYHYDQDSPPPRSKQRFDRRSGGGGGQNANSSYHRRGPPGGGGGSDRRGFLPPDAAPPPPPPPPPPSSVAAGGGAGPTTTTSFRILCPECKAYGFPPGFVAKVRDESGAFVTVHPPFASDYVRVIETVDGARREADGRPPMFSPAQEALLMVHRRILETDADDGDEDGEYGPRGKDPRDRGKTTSRLIVPKLHVGCLLGKGGKIIEQMRMETKTHIRILPRDQHTPRCVSLSEEVVQVVGDGNCVKKAVAIITDRLKESLHRDRGPFRGRMNSPEPRISQEDEYLGGVQQMPAYEESLGRPDQIRNNISMEPPGYEFDSNGGKVIEHSDILYDDIVFRILCPNDKADGLVATRDGILEMLQADVGVDVRLSDIIAGSDERVVIITSREGPDHELFPAQEAVLHIQTHIVDLGPDKDNIVTTRLLVPSSEIACFDGREGSLSDIQRQTSANVQILPREDLPSCALESDELIQIVGEIRAARNALIQVTTKLRSFLYREMSGPIQVGNINVHGAISPVAGSPRGPYQGNDIPMGAYHQASQLATSWHSKDSGGSASGSFEQGSNINDDIRQSATKRFVVPLVTRSTLEVVIPNSAVASLTMRAGSKLAQISEISGATVTLAEDRPDILEKVVRISGTPEQASKAENLLQGFILSRNSPTLLSAKLRRARHVTVTSVRQVTAQPRNKNQQPPTSFSFLSPPASHFSLFFLAVHCKPTITFSLVLSSLREPRSKKEGDVGDFGAGKPTYHFSNSGVASCISSSVPVSARVRPAIFAVWAGRAGIRGAAAPSGLRVEGASPLVCFPQSGKRGQGLLLCCLLAAAASVTRLGIRPSAGRSDGSAPLSPQSHQSCFCADLILFEHKMGL